MLSVKELGYIVVEARDLNAWQAFAIEVMGLELGHRDGDNMLSLRLDDRVHRLIVEAGPADDLVSIGFDCGTDADLDLIVARLRAKHIVVEDGGATLAQRRQVRRMVTTLDPVGNRLELYVDLAHAAAPFRSGLVNAGFMTSNGGAGHAFLPTSDRQAMLDFYTTLGFRMSDYIRQEVAPGMVVDAAFMHCNPRHHTVAFASIPYPKKIHHFMIEANARVDVGRAYDRVLAARVPLATTLGMHPNDLMFSFYVTTPSGFAIEFGADGRQIVDEEQWTVARYDQLSIWGHQAPQQLVAALA